jgi:transcription elongation factor Elf1
MVFSKCVWVASIIYKFVSNKTASYDASDIASELVEISDGRVKCRICGKAFKKLCFWKPHVARKHCDKLLVLAEKHRLRRIGSRGRGGKYSFNMQLYCSACGWTHSVVARSSTGPPNMKAFLEKIGLTACPSCGKRFEVKRFEFA